jgi:hypothetical protein
VQSDQLFPVLAIALAMVAIAGLTVVGLLLRSYRHNQRVIMGSRGTVDIAEHMAIVDDKLTNLRLAVEDLTLTARDHGVRVDGTLSHVGIVRFDAYQDLGGRQSTAVAFITSQDDGVVITTVVSREFARMYVKLVKNGEGDIPLAPEEKEAVEQARRATPFMLKPQTEGAEDEETLSEDLATLEAGAPMVLGLPGRPFEDEDKDARALERENRRRKRKGLPTIKPEEVESSLQGWGFSETPAPPGLSMAEQFVQQRKKGRPGAVQVEAKGEDAPFVDTGEDEGWPASADHDGRWTSDPGDDEGSTVAFQDDGRWDPVSEDDTWGFPVVDDDTREV